MPAKPAAKPAKPATKAAKRPQPSAPAHPLTVPPGIAAKEVRQQTHTARDGVRLYYEVVGHGPEVVALANGLGGRLYAWAPLIRALGTERYTFLTWDYRGLFESGAPEQIKRLGLPEHAEDLRELLAAIDAERAHVAGWSMGVQVGLEFATLYPEQARSLILLNGTYGHIFNTAFQPLVRLPWFDRALHAAVEWISARPELIDRMGAWVERNVEALASGQMLMSPWSKNHAEMRPAIRQYMRDIFATEFRNYLRLFQELDAHSVYHMLPHIETPTLIMSGGLDALTPAYQSRQIARRLPKARRRHLPLANHYALLEYPERVGHEVRSFLAQL